MHEPVKTFSIGFEGDAAFDETAVARRDRGAVRHRPHRVSRAAVGDRPARPRWSGITTVRSPIRPRSRPISCRKLTREHVTVALTGDGGDEVFAGYLRFGAALAADRVPRGGRPARRWPRPTGCRRSPNERHWSARARRFARFMQLPLDDRLDRLGRRLLRRCRAAARRRLRRRAARRSIGARTCARSQRTLAGRSPLSRLLAANFHSYLHDDLLVKADRMTMANSLEARSPFLDRALIEYVAGAARRLEGPAAAGPRPSCATRSPICCRRRWRGAPRRASACRSTPGSAASCATTCSDTLLAPSRAPRAYVSPAYVRQLVDEHTRRPRQSRPSAVDAAHVRALAAAAAVVAATPAAVR